MRISLKVISGIVKKDVHSLLPLILLGCVVFVAQPVVENLKLEQATEFLLFLRLGFYWLGYFIATFLLVSVLQLDPATSIKHDWLTRPIARSDWLIAKLLFMIVTVCLPTVLARFLVNLSSYGFVDSLDYALAIELAPALLATPILFAVALLTPTIKKSIFVLVIIFLLFFIPSWDGSSVIFEPLGVDIKEHFGGMQWLQSLPVLLVSVGSVLLVYWLLYCRHHEHRAWLVFCVSVVIVFFSIYPPASVFDMGKAVAIHKWMLNDQNDFKDDAVLLEHALACFPAASMGVNSVSAVTDPLLIQANWNEPIIEQAEPGSLTVATTVRSRNRLREWFSPSNTNLNIPVDWRIDRIRVQGRFTAGSIPEDLELIHSNDARSNSANISPVGTDYWLIPGAKVNALANDPTTRLELEFDLALLSPTTYELKTDGQRYEFPELGSCRAEIKPNANNIEIECIKQGAQPALVSAELVGVTASRDDNFYRANFAPDWFESFSRKRYELSIASPNLVDSSVIMISAWKTERILHKHLETPGLLGESTSICPLPSNDQFDAIEKSNWSDKSPHEISAIAVERGVRVEVLDWRKDEQKDGQSDLPVFFLLPGLGATAHSYDVLAAKLAQKYPVVAMTRRGFGDSSKPDYGYDITRLSQDVIQVLETLEIESPVLVGHSLGGEELSYLGANHPELFSGLVYLDAAYDRSKNNRVQIDILLPSKPSPLPAEMVSYETLKGYTLRTEGSDRTVPEGEVMASYDLDSGGTKHNSLYIDAIQMGLVAPDYSRIPLPALGIYAVAASPQAYMEPWYDQSDPLVQQVATRRFQVVKETTAQQRKRFGEGIVNSEVLEIIGGNHWIFVSHERGVFEAIDQFVEGLEQR